MRIKINCISYAEAGRCTHQAAPRRLLGPAACLVWEQLAGKRKPDLRVPDGCKLCVPHAKPDLQRLPTTGISKGRGALCTR